MARGERGGGNFSSQAWRLAMERLLLASIIQSFTRRQLFSQSRFAPAKSMKSSENTKSKNATCSMSAD
jgi:hypothetical protein